MLLNAVLSLKTVCLGHRDRQNGQLDPVQGGHSSAVSEGKTRCPKDIHCSKEVWEVSRGAQTPAMHNA